MITKKSIAKVAKYRKERYDYLFAYPAYSLCFLQHKKSIARDAK
jgi:hypothetical protein